jgi:hypothetical protein
MVIRRFFVTVFFCADGPLKWMDELKNTTIGFIDHGRCHPEKTSFRFFGVIFL